MKPRKPARPPAESPARLPASRRKGEAPIAEVPDEVCPTRTYPTYFRFPASARRREPIRYAR